MENEKKGSDKELPGSALRTAREDAELTVTEVAKRLFISPAYIDGIEANCYDKMPETTFIRGYIRSYARLMGLDAEQLVKEFELKIKTTAPEAQTAENNEQERVSFKIPELPLSNLQMGLGGILLFILLIFFFLPEDNVDQPAVGVTGLENIDLEDIEVDNLSQPVEPIELAEEDELVEQEDQDIDSEERLITSVELSDRLEAMFSDDCWFEVVDARGAVLTAGLGQANEIIELRGVAPLKLKIGNPAAVVISYNSQLVDLNAYPANKLIRMTLD